MTSGSGGTSGTDGAKDSGVTAKSSRRGIVNMLKVKRARTKGIRQRVNWNARGQPIGKESVTLVSFIGSFARRNFPITCDDWRKKEWQTLKQNMWDEVKETFHGIGDEHRKKIINRAGHLHRQFRTRLRSLAKDDDGNYSAEPPALYAHFSSVAPYWKDFVEYSMQEDFVKKSKKNKEQAKAMEARYKKARAGYARIIEKLIQEKIDAGEKNPVVTRLDAWEYSRRNKNGVVDDPVALQVLEDVAILSEKLGEDELTNIGTDDLLSRLMPSEYSGRVRATGWGVTKTSLQTVSTVSELSKLKNDVAFLKNEIKELKSKGYNPGMQSGGSSHMDNFDMDNEVDGERNDNHDPVLGEDLPEGKNVCYLYVDPGHRYVGRGILHNDPNDKILHGIPLEEGYVKVQFEVAEKSELKTPLPRCCDDANLVGEAPGYFLAWPRKLVSMKLETTPRSMNKKKSMHAMGHKKIEDKEKEKADHSIVAISSRQLGYPLPPDVCHDGVMDFVRFAIGFDRVTDIEVKMGPYWNADPWIEHINKENILEVLNTEWLSATSIIFYIRYLCEVYLSKSPDLAPKFSFVSPHLVSPLVGNSAKFLANCLQGYVDKDHLMFMPYNVGKHWILVAINTATENIYFMDPAHKTNVEHYRNVKTLVETAMRTFRLQSGKKYTSTMSNSFRWITVQCPKQASHDGILCGYYVGCFIEDLLCSGETKINVDFTYSPKLKSYPHGKMVRFQSNWAGYLYNRFLREMLLKK